MDGDDGEHNRVLDALEAACRVANQMRHVLAADEHDNDALQHAESVLANQRAEMQRLTALLLRFDAQLAGPKSANVRANGG